LWDPENFIEPVPLGDAKSVSNGEGTCTEEFRLDAELYEPNKLTIPRTALRAAKDLGAINEEDSTDVSVIVEFPNANFVGILGFCDQLRAAGFATTEPTQTIESILE
jgi:hypothetical protein